MNTSVPNPISELGKAQGLQWYGWTDPDGTEMRQLRQHDGSGKLNRAYCFMPDRLGGWWIEDNAHWIQDGTPVAGGTR